MRAVEQLHLSLKSSGLGYSAERHIAQTPAIGRRSSDAKLFRHKLGSDLPRDASPDRLAPPQVRIKGPAICSPTKRILSAIGCISAARASDRPGRAAAPPHRPADEPLAAPIDHRGVPADAVHCFEQLEGKAGSAQGASGGKPLRAGADDHSINVFHPYFHPPQ
jgi:hypothetical protein